MASEFVDGPGQGASGGVSSGQQDSNKLVPENLTITGESSQGMQEGITGVRLAGEVVRVKTEGLLDVLVDEGVDDFHAPAEGATGDEDVEGPSTANDGLNSLDFGEGFGEFLAGVATFPSYISPLSKWKGLIC